MYNNCVSASSSSLDNPMGDRRRSYNCSVKARMHFIPLDQMGASIGQWRVFESIHE